LLFFARFILPCNLSKRRFAELAGMAPSHKSKTHSNLLQVVSTMFYRQGIGETTDKRLSAFPVIAYLHTLGMLAPTQ
jgi:hypothetical protein